MTWKLITLRIKMREYLVGKINVVETKNEDTNIREMYWDVYKKKCVKKISCVKEKRFFKPVSSTKSSA